jgi:hypothetical protein
MKIYQRDFETVFISSNNSGPGFAVNIFKIEFGCQRLFLTRVSN